MDSQVQSDFLIHLKVPAVIDGQMNRSYPYTAKHINIELIITKYLCHCYHHNQSHDKLILGYYSKITGITLWTLKIRSLNQKRVRQSKKTREIYNYNYFEDTALVC